MMENIVKIRIPDGFLEDEMRDNVAVTNQMKKVWLVELDLFNEFDRVCRKHNISYIACGGTMLGTVRHHGYIPWDDDMDLMMMRDQYDKLCKIASVEFKQPYFFQTEETDPGFMRGYAKLRNSKTTAILKGEYFSHPRYNQGIFIDIFPLDVVVDDKKLFNKQKKLFHFYNKIFTLSNAIIENKHYKTVSNSILCITSCLHYSIGWLLKGLNIRLWSYRKFQEVCKMYNEIDGERVSMLSFDFDDLGHSLLREDLNDIIYMDYEFLRMPLIADYDEHLSHKYGDYMKPKKVPTLHGDVIFDTEIGYIDYYKKNKNEATNVRRDA